MALLGDAAHPMLLLYLAQGAAMAIEDAAVAAQRPRGRQTMPPTRRELIARCGEAEHAGRNQPASRNGTRYHFAGAGAWLRDSFMQVVGGTRLLQNYYWNGRLAAAGGVMTIGHLQTKA